MRNKWGRPRKVQRYSDISSSSDEEVEASRKNAAVAGEVIEVDLTTEQAKRPGEVNGEPEDMKEETSAIEGLSGSSETTRDLVSQVVKVEECVDLDAVTVKDEDSLSVVGVVKEMSVGCGQSAGTSEAACNSMTASVIDSSSLAGDDEDGSLNYEDSSASLGRQSKRRRIESSNRGVNEDRMPNISNIEAQEEEEGVIADEDRSPSQVTENEMSLDLRGNNTLNDIALKGLLEEDENFESLDIHDCPLLTSKAIDCINKCGKSLRILTLGNSAKHIMFNCEQKKVYGPVNLQKLIMWNVDLSTSRNFFIKSIEIYSKTLTWLDISEMQHIKCFKLLRNLENLERLVMHNVNLTGSKDPDYSGKDREAKQGISFFQVIDGLSKKIRHLDVSRSTWSSQSNFRNPSVFLEKLVSYLPALEHLDISGTNLAGKVGGGKRNRDSCSIPGLDGRVNRPLEYLGLYNTSNDACKRDSIPAKSIGGNKDEKQILAAARAFIDHQKLLEAVLNDLLNSLSGINQETGSLDSIEVIFLAMERNRRKKGVQLLGLTCLFYIVKKDKERGKLSKSMKQKLLSEMNVHNFDRRMFRSRDFTTFLFEQLVKILLEYSNHSKNNEAKTEDSDVERVAVYLLSCLMFDCDREQRRIAGNLGVVQKMLLVILNGLGRGTYDDTMDSAWLVLFNVTDEIPENSREFLDCDGLTAYLRCHKAFYRSRNLLMSMAGLMGNVAEVESLRAHLMTEELISIQYGLVLGSKQNKKNDVAFCAAELLIQILSDGEKSWKVGKPSRADVKSRLRSQMRKWDAEKKKYLEDYVSYKSLSPFRCLLKVRHTVECKLWAAWVLANLTNFGQAEKYVSMVEKEEGILEELKSCEAQVDPDFPELAVYARRALENVEKVIGDVKIKLEPQISS